MIFKVHSSPSHSVIQPQTIWLMLNKLYKNVSFLLLQSSAGHLLQEFHLSLNARDDAFCRLCHSASCLSTAAWARAPAWSKCNDLPSQHFELGVILN